MQTKSEVRTYGNYIGGKWLESTGGTIESRNPATGDLVSRAARSTPDDVAHAVEEARKTFDSGAWSSKRPSERGKVLREISDLLRKELDPLSLLLTLENGKPLADAKGELLNAANVLEYYASAARHIVGKVPRYSGTDVSLVVHEPVGVCGLIVPWNSPISLLSWKLGPALAAGCTVVIKPAGYTSGVSMEFVKLLTAVGGLPSGTLNAVTGPGETVGSELVRNPKVDKVSFTGSTETGQKIMEMASSNLKKINLECGGKSADIVFDDANMNAAVPGAVWSIFRSAGQSCNAGSRLLVQDSVYDAFMRSFKITASAIKIGNGLDPDVEMGPLVSESQLNRVMEYINSGQDEARLTLGGKRLVDGDHSKGYFVQPTVFEGVERDMRIFQEEIFGPVLCVLPFGDEEDAISIANDTKFGLAGDLWSRSLPRVMKVSRGLRTGTVWVNRHLNPGPEVPFGGYKQSGLGRETGMEGLAEFLQTKHISLQLTDSVDRVRR
ncbi:MAG TPA: aldehyde dehydrogenase family protein [Nitrososphaerales archaeon]|nr:aldehyde dehydrogenase family protein [Nitrososphaerales archaeon]